MLGLAYVYSWYHFLFIIPSYLSYLITTSLYAWLGVGISSVLFCLIV